MNEVARITLNRKKKWDLYRGREQNPREQGETSDITLTYEVAEGIDATDPARTSEFSQMACALLKAFGETSSTELE